MILRHRGVVAFAALLSALAVQTASAASMELITNGSFEDGGGSFAGWTVLDQADGSGSWFVQTGTASPLNLFGVPAPPEGSFAAMTDQFGPGSHVLYQDFVVPVGVTAATLSFERFIQNFPGTFTTPDTLDYTVFPNQQARVDIMTTAADPFSVAGGDVLLNVFQTSVGDDPVSGYTVQSNDLGAFLAAHGGETLRLRFAEVDNSGNFNMGVDSVSLTVTTGVPEPSAFVLLGLGVASLGVVARRRRAA